jgi:hypothetical protein
MQRSADPTKYAVRDRGWTNHQCSISRLTLATFSEGQQKRRPKEAIGHDKINREKQFRIDVLVSFQKASSSTPKEETLIAIPRAGAADGEHRHVTVPAHQGSMSFAHRYSSIGYSCKVVGRQCRQC